MVFNSFNFRLISPFIFVIYWAIPSRLNRVRNLFLLVVKKLLPQHAMAEIFEHVSKELAMVRATAMEGSFGTQKEHYDLRRVKARTELALT